MYKYIPKASILREMKIRKTGYWWDKEYVTAQKILKRYHLPPEWETVQVFRQFYKQFEFYSPKKLTYVPLRGRLLPVAMFEEIERN